MNIYNHLPFKILEYSKRSRYTIQTDYNDKVRDILKEDIFSSHRTDLFFFFELKFKNKNFTSIDRSWPQNGIAR